MICERHDVYHEISWKERKSFFNEVWGGLLHVQPLQTLSVQTFSSTAAQIHCIHLLTKLTFSRVRDIPQGKTSLTIEFVYYQEVIFTPVPIACFVDESTSRRPMSDGSQLRSWSWYLIQYYIYTGCFEAVALTIVIRDFIIPFSSLVHISNSFLISDLLSFLSFHQLTSCFLDYLWNHFLEIFWKWNYPFSSGNDL